MNVTIANGGGTGVENISITIDFGGATGFVLTPASYSGLTLAAGASQMYSFSVFIANGTTIGPVAISADVAGDELISGASVSDSQGGVSVTITTPPDLQINVIDEVIPGGRYTDGSSFDIRVQLVNGPGSDVDNVTLVIYFNETGYTATPASQFVANISAGTSRTIQFTIDISGASPGDVLINANYTGWTAAASPISKSGANTPLVIRNLASSNLAVDSIVDATGLGTYVEGMTFDVNVTLSNTGELDADVTAISLTWNTATGYSHPAIMPLTVSGGSTRTVTITVTIALGATTGSITIDCDVTAAEEITGNDVSTSSGSNDLTVSVLGSAVLDVVEVGYVTGSGTYVQGMTLDVSVNITNTGDATANSLTVSLSFSAFGYSAPTANIASLAGSATAEVIITVTINAAATTGAITIDASVTGTEEISGDVLSDVGATTPAVINVQASANAFISLVEDTGLGIYIQGSIATINVTLNNTGGTDVIGVTLQLTFNSTLSAAPVTGITIPAGGSIEVSVSLNTTTAVLPQWVVLDAQFSGVEEYSLVAISDSDSDVTDTIQVVDVTNVPIDSVTVLNALPTYVQGMSLQVNVTLDNSAGATAISAINISLSFGGASGYTSPDLLMQSLGIGEIKSFTMNVLIDLTTATVGIITIDASFAGMDIFGIVGDVGADTPATITVQQRAIVAVTTSAPAEVAQDMDFNVSVTIDNTGGTAIENGTITLTLGSGSGYSWSNPSGITVGASSTVVVQITVTVGPAATTGNRVFTATLAADELISGRSVGDADFATVNVLQSSNVVIDSIVTGSTSYQAGETGIEVNVTMSNLGEASVSGFITITSNVSNSIVTVPSAAISAGLSELFTVIIAINGSMFGGEIEISARFDGLELYTNKDVNVTTATIVVLTILEDYIVIESVGGSWGTSGVGDSNPGIITGVAVGATFPIYVNVTNNGTTRDMNVTNVDITFWDANSGVPALYTGFIFVNLTNAGNVSAGSSMVFTIWVTAPVVTPNDILVTVNVTAFNVNPLNTKSLNQVDVESAYSDWDGVNVVLSFLTIDSVYCASHPSGNVQMGSGDVDVTMEYQVSSSSHAPISINISALLSDMGVIVGGITTPADGAITIPALGTANFTVNFTVSDTIVVGQPLDVDVTIENFNGTQGASTTVASTYTLNIVVPVTMNSYYWEVLLGGSWNLNGTFMAASSEVNFTINATGVIDLTLRIHSTSGSFDLSWNFTNAGGTIWVINVDSGTIGAINDGNVRFELLTWDVGSGSFVPQQDLAIIFLDKSAPVVVDLTVDDVDVLTLGNADVEASGTSLLVLNASDISGVASVSLWVDDPAEYVALSLDLSGNWTLSLTSAITIFDGIWQAGKQSMPFTVNVNTTDTNGVSSTTAFAFTLTVIDTTVPVLDMQWINAVTGVDQEPLSEQVLRIDIPRPAGETFIRNVIMYYSTQAPAGGNSRADWEGLTGVKNISFSRVEGDKFLGTLPAQQPGTTLYWAVFVEDYAGNSNAADLETGDGQQIVIAQDFIETIKPYMGFAFLGLIGFGIVFSISFRINQGVKSMKKAKKVSAAVKKAGVSKAAPGSGKKTPVSKDIPTRLCPICKAKIAADSTECPYCHKKF
ncbi:MAG: beta strand repeat-containing protein [Promethearchaeota archaeon]